MPNILLLATAWGAKHGGINAFNADLAVALATVLAGRGVVFCSVFQPSAEDLKRAQASGVTLININRPTESPGYEAGWASDVWNVLKAQHPDEKIDWWVGHDVTTGYAAVECVKTAGYGKSVVIMHMNYADYQNYKSGVGEKAQSKSEAQRRLFPMADRCFANGPLLRDALKDILRHEVSMLIPGFAEIPIAPSLHRLNALTFGRMDRESDRIKQGGLAVASFAAAISFAHSNPAPPPLLTSNPQIRVIGIKEPGGDDEQLLRDLAQKKAKRVVNVIALPFNEDRNGLFDEIGRANIALMLSWHEGFGLTGWEAIAAEIPLILSKQTGLWQLLAETFGERIASGYVHSIDIRGKEGSDETNNFAEEDETSVRDIIIQIAAGLNEAQDVAKELKRALEKKLVCTWAETALKFLKGLGEEPDGRQERSSQARSEGAQFSSKAKSKLLHIPSQIWPQSMVDKGVEMPDSLLLRPEAAVVPFHRLRVPSCDEIIDWAVQPALPIKLRLQTGSGGTGKTRLLIEVARRLATEYTWRAGFVDRSQNLSLELAVLLKERRPCLLVVDHAESRSAEIAEIVAKFLHSPDAPLARLVLIARDAGDWWERLGTNSGIDQATSSVLRGLDTKNGPYKISQEDICLEHRQEIFDQAITAFSEYKDVEKPDTLPNLSGEEFNTPLFIHLLALATITKRAAMTDRELLTFALEHERRYWGQVADSIDQVDDNLMIGLEQAIALITLIGGVDDPKRAKEIIASIARLHSVSLQDKVFRYLRMLYPRKDGIGPLLPDLLGETLVIEVLHSNEGLLDVAFHPKIDKNFLRHGLKVLTRLAKRLPSEEKWLRYVLEKNLVQHTENAVSVGAEAGSPMPEIHASAIRNAEPKEIKRIGAVLQQTSAAGAKLSDRVKIEFERQSIQIIVSKQAGRKEKREVALYKSYKSLADNLRDAREYVEAEEAARKALSYAERAFRSSATSDRNRLAVAYSTHGLALKRLNRYADAYTALARAERISSDLATEQNDDLLARWASDLGNLSGILEDMNDLAESTERAEKVESIFRRISIKHPERYTGHYARSLSNSSQSLSRSGRFVEALAKAEKSESIWRSLSLENFEEHTASWANALANLGTRLSELGRYNEALDKKLQVVGINEKLARKRPDIYTVDFAIALGSAAGVLQTIGRLDEGLEKAQQCEAILRKLAAEQRGIYSPSWAQALTVLSNCSANVGQYQTAVDAAQEAEKIYYALSLNEREVWELEWATSLNLLATQLSNVGRLHEGFEKAKLSEQIWRKIFNNQPNPYQDDWARVCLDLSSHLSDVGEPDAAIERAAAAEVIYKRLAEQQPEAFTRQWAKSNGVLAVHLLSAGKYLDALKSAKLAENLYGHLSQSGFDAFGPDWIRSVGNVGTILGKLEDYSGALTLAKKVEALWSNLADQKLGSHTSEWVKAYANLADATLQANGPEKAEPMAERAVELTKQYAVDMPALYSRWLGFARRVLAECYLRNGQAQVAMNEVEQAVSCWRVALENRPGDEPLQVAKTFLIKIKAEIILGRNAAAISSLEEMKRLLKPALLFNPSLLHPVILELSSLMEWGLVDMKTYLGISR